MKTGYEHIKTYDELVTFQRMMVKKYPYYPLEQKDWNKINRDTITVEGLKQIPILKRKIIMGNHTKIDIHNYIALLRLYAEAEGSLEKLREYQKENNFYFYSGQMPDFKELLNPKTFKLNPKADLIGLGFAQENKLYDEKLLEYMMKWENDLIQDCYKLGRKEGMKL